MTWLVFSYSLPSKAKSSPRVTLWRRLRRIGAIGIKTGVYILPERDDTIEAFQWLAQEIQDAGGEALIIHVQYFDGLSNEEIIELFRETRRSEYLEIDQKAQELEKTIMDDSSKDAELSSQLLDKLLKLQKSYTEVHSLDFFDCPSGQEVAVRLRRIEQNLRKSVKTNLTEANITEYVDKRWVTRPRPFIDRLACIWLIRRFINPEAMIRYSLQPHPDEIAFDFKDCEFGHQGNLCSFETMIMKFRLQEAELRKIAEIVHELDLRDGYYAPPEAIGVETIIRGWLLGGLSDQELESRGIELFEGLYLAWQNHK